MADNDEELETRIHPFTVKDALYLHDKKISDTQRIVTSFEDKFKVLLERINEGVSPTMRRIEAKESEIERQIIQVDSKIEVKFAEVKGELKVLDNHFSDKFTEVDRFLSHIRDLQWKVIGAVLIGGATAFGSVWVYVQQLKTRVTALPSLSRQR
jgi:hypothetical protein